jgi:hypothetical protein
VISSVQIQGARKVKNFTIETLQQDSTADENALESTSCVAWVMVYVPEGMADNPGEIQYSETEAVRLLSMYVPEYHIILSGITSPDNPTRAFAPVSRLLNSNSCVMLLYRCMGKDEAEISVHVSYLCAFA